ncbi:thiamine pyrophosphate-binding protein [Castellaniella sp.]|uniref:thiamine pyrophosphate-binding protein n=1 Tax=Castellaniella sp. TaxID=1955812 RepID=UPI003565DDEF
MDVQELAGRTLLDMGVETVFGVMGEVNMYTMHHFVAGGGRYVKAAGEAGAVQMAMGYASISGRIGVATTTCGPGFTNTITALTEGARAHHPLVVLTGQGRDDLRGYMQSVDQQAFTRPTGAGFERPDNMADIQPSLVRAFRRAHAEKRPIVHELPPYNLHNAVDIPYRRYALDAQPIRAELIPGDAWDSAIGMIATAKRPLILVGYGAVLEGVSQELSALADRLGAPIVTTLRAKDYLRDSGAYLGLMGVSCRSEAVEAMLASDCVIAFGASLNTYTTSNGTYLRGKRVIAFDGMVRDVSKYVIPDVAIHVNLRAAINYIMHWLDEAEVPNSGFAAEEVVVKACRAIRTRRTLQNPEFNAADFLTYDKALAVIDETVGKRILVTEGGRYKYSAWHNLFVDDPRNFVPSLSYGCIGVGLGHGIGAAVADPESTVVVVVGDGGLMNAGLSELQTIQNENLKVVVVVCNDSAYGAEYHKFVEQGLDPGLTRLRQPVFSTVAGALQGTGIRVATVADLPRLKQAIEQWKGDGLLLVELVVDTRSSE